jgi:hypothetical protein
MESLLSFPVGLFHPLQHASLSRRTPVFRPHARTIRMLRLPNERIDFFTRRASSPCDAGRRSGRRSAARSPVGSSLASGKAWSLFSRMVLFRCSDPSSGERTLAGSGSVPMPFVRRLPIEPRLFCGKLLRLHQDGSTCFGRCWGSAQSWSSTPLLALWPWQSGPDSFVFLPVRAATVQICHPE